MEKIISIEEVYGVPIHSMPNITGSNGSRLGMSGMISSLFGGEGNYDGYKVVTSEHTYSLLIANGQCCCEDWGYFSSDDDIQSFVGKALVSVEAVDSAYNKTMMDKVYNMYLDDGGISFVNFNFEDGSTLQIAVYNQQNGYYGHAIYFIKDAEVILADTI